MNVQNFMVKFQAVSVTFANKLRGYFFDSPCIPIPTCISCLLVITTHPIEDARYASVSISLSEVTKLSTRICQLVEE